MMRVMQVPMMLVMGVSLLGAPARAQLDSVAARDLADVEACLARKSQRDRSSYACIGSIAKACMDRPGGSSTLGMKVCSGRETDAWDSLLNRAYQRLRRQYPAAIQAKLKDIQRAWIKWRETKCDLGFTLFEGGTLAAVVAGDCVMETTAIRAIELGRIAGPSEN